ncbi:MAG: pilus assembly protein PilM [Geobacteraceae bacterium]|nr:pilus assembly protein PilM [Geobacteraceae bacterium]
MFSRKSLGVSVSSSAVSFVRVGGSPSAPYLEAVSSRLLSPGTLCSSMRELNILNPQGFVIALQEARNSLFCRGKYVSVSLPDSVGRVMMLDMEERFKNRSEGLDILRWKLKKKLPFDVADAHLDFQQVATRENGDIVLLVVLAFQPVISQYEEMFSAAGLVPTQIDLNCFNLNRVFERRLATSEDYALLTYFDSHLGIMFFSRGKPEFIRIRELAGGDTKFDSVHKEVRFSFLSYKARFPERVFRDVFCIAPLQMAKSLCGVARDAIGCEPVLLDTKSALEVRGKDLSVPESLFPFTSAIGTAIRAL